MSWQIVCANDVTPSRWRNGGGWTRELLAWPGDDWTLRISVADIEADGPFSVFPGVDRWIAVVQGGGMRLAESTLRAGDAPLAFDGGTAPQCRLLAGPTRDFNLMHRRGRGRMSVQPAVGLSPSAAWCGLFSVGGGVLQIGTQGLSLPPLSLAWGSGAAQFQSDAAAWWLSLELV